MKTLTREDMVELVMHSSRDADAWFRTGVITTGIYCRPSCRARKPRPENMLFFQTVTEARAAGFRACKRCLPDQDSSPDPSAFLERVRKAAEVEPTLTVRDVAVAVRTSERHLRRVFQESAHCSPKAFLARLALAQAARLLRCSQTSVLEVALQVGYGSLSSFNRAFRRLYGITPSRFRKNEVQS